MSRRRNFTQSSASSTLVIIQQTLEKCPNLSSESLSNTSPPPSSNLSSFDFYYIFLLHLSPPENRTALN
jgi:hypothetical protein